MVEHLVVSQKVAGSIPVVLAKFERRYMMESEKEIEHMIRQVKVFRDCPLWDNGGPMSHALIGAVINIHRLNKISDKDKS